MKKLKSVPVVIGLISVLTLMSFVKDKTGKEIAFNCKEIDKSFVHLKDNLYAGKCEVTNSLYLEFINDLTKKNNVDLLKKAQIDSLNWRDRLTFNAPLVELYFRHPAYANYPVVNVSYEAATLFCEWLTVEYNSNTNRKFKIVKFRLPTQSEWEFAAKGGLDACIYSWGNRLFENNRNNCNFWNIGDENLKYDTLSKKIVVDFPDIMLVAGSLTEESNITVPVDSYPANKFGLYNVCGNAAEMIQEKGISKGGSWRSPGGDVTIKSKGKYSKSANDLGFRYFVDIIEQ